MPRTKGAGHSRATIDKATGLSKLLSQHVNTVKKILEKPEYSHYPQVYHYIDAYAGPGYNEVEQCDGSPVIFLKTAKTLGMKYRAWFVEKEANLSTELSKRIKDFDSCEVLRGDNANVVPQIARGLPDNAYGLVYADPNGIPNFDMLSKVSMLPELYKFDILIRYNAAAVKRNEPQTGKKMLDLLSKINKKYWIIRDILPGDIWQWTFLLGLNWPGLSEWRSQGFMYAITPKGIKPEAAELIDKLNNPKSQRTLGDLQ